MGIEKSYRINSLSEFYQPLLAEKQNDYLELCYGDDYSLGGIARNSHVSRQAVYDNIKRTESILEDYEAKLYLYTKFQVRNQQADRIRRYVREDYPDDVMLDHLINHPGSLEEE